VDRLRLSVALLIDEPQATEIAGLRRALGGDPSSEVPPHVTLVPPVNVPYEEIDRALTIVRQAAASSPGPLRATVGPVATFAANGVLYLELGTPSVTGLDVDRHVSESGEGSESGRIGLVDVVKRLGELRDRVLRPPLWRHLTHDFVPHVTLRTNPGEALRLASLVALAGFELPVTFRSISLLQLGVDGTWRSLADTPLGKPAIRGRGTFVRELRLVNHCAPDVAVLFGGATVGEQILEARGEDGFLVGALGFSTETFIVTNEDGGTTKRVRGRLTALAVDEDEQRTGVGAMLVSEVLRHLEAKGIAYALAFVDSGQVDHRLEAALSALGRRFGFVQQTDRSLAPGIRLGIVSLRNKEFT
jgi:ribosomal protein S18 acetylase RimI-like enzyme/2'-5' RNA ligase